MDSTLSMVATEEAVLLPAREVPAFVNVVNIGAWNGAVAVNGLSFLSTAAAGAAQVITVSQS
jgi:hypothetical protein